MEIQNVQSDFEEFEKYDSLTDLEIFTKIWTEPRRIFKYINETKYEKYFYVLLILAGISAAFDRASNKGMGDNSSLAGVVLTCVIFGGLFGWLSYYIYAALLSWTGKWLNGKGTTDSIIKILAYAMLPSAISLIFLVPQIAVYGIDLFTEEGDLVAAGISGNIIFWSSFSIKLILGIFTIVFTIVGISEVQKLSIGKAILNLILPLLVIIGPLVLIVLLFYSF